MTLPELPPLSSKWSEDDLAFNRRGALSPHQRRSLLRRWGLWVGIFVVGSTAIIGWLAYAHSTGLIGWDTTAAKLCDGFGISAVIFTLVPSIRRAFWLAALRHGTVVELAGRCDYGRGPDFTGELGHWVAGHRVRVAQPVDDLFVKEVRAYLLPRTKLVIAIEKQ